MASSFPSLRQRPTLPSVGISKATPVYLRPTSAPVHSSVSSINSVFATGSPGVPRGSDEDYKSLICRAFVPHIAVHVSTDTDELAQEKGFANFKDMLRPYGEVIQGRITVRDSQGVSTSYDDYGVRFVGLKDVAASGERWETGLARSHGFPPKSDSARDNICEGGSLDDIQELLNLHLERMEELIETSLTDGDVPSGKSFYTLYLRRLLSGLPLSPHETYAHPVACVIAISSRNQTPIETLRNLYTTGSQTELPSYVNTDYLRYYVLVHDEGKDDINKSMTLFDQMKKHFGLHCHLLRLRSGGRSVMSDDDAVVVPRSQWLSAAEELAELRARDIDEGVGQPTLCLPDSDATAIQTMVREMAQVSVIPFMERCIATWNDQVASRRRGLSGRFLSLSKRYFGSTSSRNSVSVASNYDPSSESYNPVTPEAQMRKLADFAFMLRDWRLAHSTYDLLRTDFNNDQAWKCHAGAQEMAAISLILTGTALTSKVRVDTIDPMLDLACYSYMNRCADPYSALRCLLVAVELLRIRGGGAADEAAQWAMRARSKSPVDSFGHALITERVGSCFEVREGAGSGAWGGRKRKSAMWSMMAAREWVDAGKPSQARYCIDRSLAIYDGTQFGAIAAYVDLLKSQTGYAPLVDVDSDGRPSADSTGEIESELLDVGSKRKSYVGTGLAGDLAEKLDDNFVDS
ncbi:hypothetical protein RUND412_011272 [Rhizina undulata]